MTLVDTSVWIELLNGKLGSRLAEADLVNLATCGPVTQEVFQGLRAEPALAAAREAFRQAFLALPMLSDPLPSGLFLAAAEIYRTGRAKGYTIRSGTDCLIAAIALANKVPIWHNDRDFEVIAQFTGLQCQHLG